MRLRHAADYRTVLWVVFTTVLVAVQYARPNLIPYFWWVSCYFALTCGVIAHNHNHSPTFVSKRTNQLFANWISIFYGYPTFAWIPTHNLNHHKFVNRNGDATITWRYTNKHNAFIAATYFFVSSYWQSGPIKAFIRNARANNRPLYRKIMTQYAVWAGAHVLLAALGVLLHGWATGLYVYLMVCFIPAFFALWTIMLFNYIQHVHTDAWSEHSHSRNFVSPWLNFMLFNNGYHGAHHENPGTHWSLLRQAHEKIADKIDPRLMHRSMWGFFFRQYALAPFFPKLGTVQVGRAPFDDPALDEKNRASTESALSDEPSMNSPLVRSSF